MSNTIALLDKAKDLCEPATDYRLSKRLGISHATVSRCRNRGGTLDNRAVRELALFLGQPFEDVLALIELDRAKTPKARAYWERVAPRLGAPLVVALVAALTLTYNEARAASRNVGISSTFARLQAIHYAK